MRVRRFTLTALTIGVALLLMAASASAITITYNTVTGTQFVSGGLTLNNSSGAAATLKFVPNASSTSAVPSNINLGDFLLACPTCTTQ